MATGTVKWFNATKGFGFIVPDEGGKDVFVHITAVQAAGMTTLTEGQRLSYEVEDDRKVAGLSAVADAPGEPGRASARRRGLGCCM